MKNFLSTAAMAFLSSVALFAQTEKPELDPSQTRELIRQWVKTERLVSEEKTAWKVEQQRMQELLDVYQKELKLLNEELEKAGGAADLIDKNKEKLESELKEYRASQRILADAMARMLPRIRALFGRLPQPLKDELSADKDALDAPDALSQPRDVLRSLISVLTIAGRFNRSVTLAEETRILPDGKKISVDVLYLGLARAFYATHSGDVAGVGVPQKDSWAWQPRPDIADDVRQAIAVYRKDKQPQLLKLPIAIDKEVSK